MKKESLATIFQARLEREGGLQPYRATLKSLMESGMQFTAARWRAMKEHGYVSGKVERQLHEEWLKSQRDATFREVAKEVRGIDKEELRIERFEDAIDTLPANASTSAELAWVAAHPAMSRKARQKNKTADVEITADDVLYAPHGPAPSRSAVNQLIYWSNHPNRFYEGMLSEGKKKMEEGQEAGVDLRADPTLPEIEAFLDSVEVKVDVTVGAKVA